MLREITACFALKSIHSLRPETFCSKIRGPFLLPTPKYRVTFFSSFLQPLSLTFMELQNGKIWVLRAVNSKDKPVWMWQDIWGSKLTKNVLFLFFSNFTHPVKKFRDPGGFEENLKNFHESGRNSKPKAKIRMTNGDFPNSRQSTINFLAFPPHYYTQENGIYHIAGIMRIVVCASPGSGLVW